MKVAIIGGTNSWKDAPYDDKEWEIWVLGNQVQSLNHPRISRIFEIHNDFSNRPDGYPQWLADLAKSADNGAIPMVVGEQYPVVDDHIECFDFEKARELLNGLYLTSTPAYMVAYALYSYPDLEEIGLWGVDMAVDDQEYFYEQPVMTRWLGLLTERGIKITLPPGCPLGEPHYLEGVTANSPEGHVLFNQKAFLSKAAAHRNAIERITEEMNSELTRYRALINSHDGGAQVYEKMAQLARAYEGGQVFESLDQGVKLVSEIHGNNS